MTGDTRVVYRQRYVRCGRTNCRTCREGSGHGPYWYSYAQGASGGLRYIGRSLAGEADAGDIGCRAEGSGAQADQGRPVATQTLRVYLLGRFAVERIIPGTTPVRVTWRRSTAAGLLQILLLHTRLDREQAVNLLFPDEAVDTAQCKLSTALHALRRALEPGLRPGEQGRYIKQHRTLLNLDLDAATWIDARVFQSLVKEARHAARPRAILERAVRLYAGDLLPDEPHAWSEVHREQFHRHWQEALLQLAECLRRSALYERCLTVLHRLEADDPLFEPAARLHMQVHAEQGRPAAAVATYRRLACTLRDDLAVAPSVETRRLAEAIRRGELPHVR